MATKAWPRARFAIDRGGTFTDVYAEVHEKDGSVKPIVKKLLSVDPSNYKDAPREGIRRVLEYITGKPHPRDTPLDTSHVDSIRMGTTVATNALLERQGARTALIVTRGFADLLEIGTQSRPDIFDLKVSTRPPVYSVIVEARERVLLASAPHVDEANDPVLSIHSNDDTDALSGSGAGSGDGGGGKARPRIRCPNGDDVVVLEKLHEPSLRSQLRRARKAGCTSAAVVFLHSYAYVEHEKRAGQICREEGFEHVSLSHEAMPAVRAVPRGHTAAADAYLTPVIRTYLRSFLGGFDFAAEVEAGESTGDGVVRLPPGAPEVLFMQSDGGLTHVEGFSGHRAVLSGPAGGVVGYALTTYGQAEEEEEEEGEGQAAGAAAEPADSGKRPGRKNRPVVGFDMGGTSTDVSRYGGAFEQTQESETAGVQMQVPQLDVHTVAAGGGSRLVFRDGLFAVGPESAGAHPGPVCYRKPGGLLAVTDANVVLGRLQPSMFPAIFGPSEDESLDAEAATRAMAGVTSEVNRHRRAAWERQQGSSGAGTVAAPADLSTEQVASGFLRVANEAMCRPIRALTQMRGHDVSTHVLACFGGAGGQHACAVARNLGIRTIFVHRYSGILSAFGIGLAPEAREAQRPTTSVLAVPAGSVTSEEGDVVRPTSEASVLEGLCRDLLSVGRQAVELLDQGRKEEGGDSGGGDDAESGAGRGACVTMFVNLRFKGTDTAKAVPLRLGLGGEAGGSASGSSDSVAHEQEEQEEQEEEETPWEVLAGAEGEGTSGAGKALVAALQAAPEAFTRAYEREYGFVLRGREVIVDDVRARAVRRGRGLVRVELPDAGRDAPLPAPEATVSVYFDSESGDADGGGSVGGARLSTPVYALRSMPHGPRVPGPAIIRDDTSTVVVEPGFVAQVTRHGDIRIDAAKHGTGKHGVAVGRGAGAASDEAQRAEAAAASSTGPDPILLSVYGHRFMSIAEQMGRTLQRTSISVNIKERLDFSCALFGPQGGLVANAPHIPVHLGAMQEAVRFQLEYWCGGSPSESSGGSPSGSEREGLSDGDVLVSNHPQLAGGSHLPDITVITPVFEKPGASTSKGDMPAFFVASRGHHADIGGITPGSMPPLSTSLVQEGAAIVAFKLVRGGKFQEDGILGLLAAPGEQGIEGCAGCRNTHDVTSDLKAQVAANHKGIQLVRGLMQERGHGEVEAYMGHIQDAAAAAVQGVLARQLEVRGGLAGGEDGAAVGDGSVPLEATLRGADQLDDGTPIRLTVRIRGRGHRLAARASASAGSVDDAGAEAAAEGGASAVRFRVDDPSNVTCEFDFSGTGPQVRGNLNAPPAVSYSAAIYALRCMVERDVPLNQGCLRPVRFIIPEGSVLNPSADAAVVGGNVLTSQRVVDVVLRAFGAAAASYGCMNNTTFGNESLGYYETVCGGCGAGPTWQGTSGRHSHMTNTRITDPETLERRYPAILRRFHLRHGSGGQGANRGGDGVVRELQFRAPLAVSLLTERRAMRPWGLEGGGAGLAGLNLLFRSNGAGRLRPAVSLGSKATVQVTAGDVIRVCTPGAGGYGAGAGDGAGSSAGAGARLYEGRGEQIEAPPEWAVPLPLGTASHHRTAGDGSADAGHRDGSADGPGVDPWVQRWARGAGREAQAGKEGVLRASAEQVLRGTGGM